MSETDETLHRRASDGDSSSLNPRKRKSVVLVNLSSPINQVFMV